MIIVLIVINDGFCCFVFYLSCLVCLEVLLMVFSFGFLQRVFYLVYNNVSLKHFF